MTASATSEQGDATPFSAVTPYLMLNNAAAASDFDKAALAAIEAGH